MNKKFLVKILDVISNSLNFKSLTIEDKKSSQSEVLIAVLVYVESVE